MIEQLLDTHAKPADGWAEDIAATIDENLVSPLGQHRRLRPLLLHLLNHLGERLSSAQAARIVSVERKYFSKFFLRETGFNFSWWNREVRTSKTGKRILIEWSEALRSAVKRALAETPQVRQPIVCNLQGKAYTVDGFNTIFYRRMSALVNKPGSGLMERFQFRDLRAKSASDDTVEAASKRLGHADPKITERVYRRKAERAKPLR
jgi:integrase